MLPQGVTEILKQAVTRTIFFQQKFHSAVIIPLNKT